MYENILGLGRVCDDLRRDIVEGRLPGAILLSGPRYGAKSSIALETARAVSCHHDGAWNCTCHSCRLHRTLRHPNTLLAGPRYFSLEMYAAIAAFRRAPRAGTAFLLIRSVRKLLRRFDPLLWQDARIKKALPVAEALEITLGGLEDEVDRFQSAGAPGEQFGEPGQWEPVLAEIGKEVPRLEQLLPHDPVPVDLVRAVASWAHISSSGGRRVVVFEEAHTLQEGARNAMLKILEEPPTNTLFVLTSSRRSALIPTIRSRLRSYEVGERSVTVQEDVQRRIFRVETPSPSLSEFFRGQSGTDGEDWSTLGRELIDLIDTGASTLPAEQRIRAMLAASSPRQGAEYFLDALEEEIGRRLRTDTPGERITRETLFRWGPIIQRYWSRIDSRNMNPGTVLASAVLALRNAVGVL